MQVATIQLLPTLQTPAFPPVQRVRSRSFSSQTFTSTNTNTLAMSRSKPQCAAVKKLKSFHTNEKNLGSHLPHVLAMSEKSDGYPGPLTKRGHEESWTYPPLVDTSIKRPTETNILRCDDVKGLEQGIYIISRPLRINPTNTPEGRHHMYLQVYQDPDAKPEINRAQTHVNELEKEWKDLDNNNAGQITEKQLLEKKLIEAKQTLESIAQNANRARMMENSGLTKNDQGKLGSIVTISSMDHGQTILPDLNQPYLVISPILTKSDVEKVKDGVKWVDPDMNSYSECITWIQNIPYVLLGHNCKVAASELARSAVNAIPGLTSEMRELAEANLTKPINSNIPILEILGNAILRPFKMLFQSTDQSPRFMLRNGVKAGTRTSYIEKEEESMT